VRTHQPLRGWIGATDSVERMAQLASADLETFAKETVTYEVTTMVAEVDHPNLHGSDRVLAFALLEAVLVHVRLLDDFHGQTSAKAHPDDFTAEHYLPTWTPRRTLSQSDREAINAQLAHMSIKRVSGYGWRVEALVADTCRMFVSFVDTLRASDPRRAAWFDTAHQAAKAMVAKHTAVVRAMAPMSLPKTTTSATTAVTTTHSQPPANNPMRRATGPRLCGRGAAAWGRRLAVYVRRLVKRTSVGS